MLAVRNHHYPFTTAQTYEEVGTVTGSRVTVLVPVTEVIVETLTLSLVVRRLLELRVVD